MAKQIIIKKNTAKINLDDFSVGQKILIYVEPGISANFYQERLAAPSIELVAKRNSRINYFLKNTITKPKEINYIFNLDSNSKLEYKFFCHAKSSVIGTVQINHLKNDSIGNINAALKFSDNGESKLQFISTHIGKNTKGNIKIKALSQDSAQALIDGLIKIKKQAINTESFLTENILMISDQSEIKAKPDLEILNNEVKASHSATISRINQNELYYLTSRGLDVKQAKKLIISGFLSLK